MDFTDKEYDTLIAKKVDKVVFYTNNSVVFAVDFEKLLKEKIENDPALKKQLLQHVLKSEE
jgi:hypothetical protein